MFVLRIIEDTREMASQPFHQVVKNFELGDAYAVLKKGQTILFDEIIKENCLDAKEFRAIIKGDKDALHFVRVNNELVNCTYFIMNEQGTTFEKL